MSNPTSAGHRPQLDGLRALAVGGVLMCHTLPWLPYRWEVGAASVRLFFVLSGFLIVGILLRARREAEAVNASRGRILTAFYARRFFRIFPIYYGVLLLSALLDLPAVRQTCAWHLTYLSNYYVFAYHTNQTPAYLSHLWSLSVEEQCYLIWPWVVLFLPLRRLPIVLLIAIASAPLSRLLFCSICPAGPHPWHRGVVVTPSCLDALGGGSFLAVLWEAGPSAQLLRRRARRFSLAAGLVLLASMELFARLKLDWRWDVACKHLAFALVSIWLVDRAAEGFGGAARRLLESRPLVYLGGISYGIYVYHEFVPTLIMRIEKGLEIPLHFPTEGGLTRLAYVAAVTLPLAALSWHFFEKPLNSFKSRFPYLRKDGRAASTEPAAVVRLEAAA